MVQTPYKQALADLDKRLIEAALKATGRNIARTAYQLGLTRNTLYARIKAYKL